MRLLKLVLLACVLVLGATLVRGVTGMLEAAVYGARQDRVMVEPRR